MGCVVGGGGGGGVFAGKSLCFNIGLLKLNTNFFVDLLFLLFRTTAMTIAIMRRTTTATTAPMIRPRLSLSGSEKRSKQKIYNNKYIQS